VGREPGKRLIASDEWLDTLRIAKEVGDMTALLPAGITHMADIPASLHDAITAGLQFVSFDELPKDERPRKAIWWDKDEMRAHWAMVDRLRDEKYGSSDKKASGGGPEQQNGYMKELLV
jgi:hypothetical protein